MWIFTVILILGIAGLLTYFWKEDFCDTFPMTIAAFLLLLYLLAFAGALPAVDWIGLIALIVLVMAVCLMKREKRRSIIKQLTNTLCSPKCMILLVMLAGITFLTKDRIATWWDDINFWAADAKALYFTGGFSGKYGNVAPEFGDYPPALQLMKWWFLHMNRTGFQEGLMFAAYYSMNLIFLFPLLKRIRVKNPFLNWVCTAGACAGVCLIPGIVDGMEFEGTCADITMGILYGALLLAIWEDKEHTTVFYYTRIGLYLSILILTKSVGIEWAIFGLLFFLLFAKQRRGKSAAYGKKTGRNLLLLMGTALLTEGSWLGYCLLQRRVAKLTSAGVKMAVGGNFSLPDNLAERAMCYLKGFALYPMHTDETRVLDLSALGFLFLLFVLLIVMKRTKVLENKETGRLVIFTIVTALAAYGIIFLGHLTIFAGELQYQDPSVMALSINRYGAPFTLGMLYLLLGILLERKKQKWLYPLCIGMILATTCYPGYLRGFFTYHDTLKEDLNSRAAMVEPEADEFLEKAGTYEQLVGKRTLYLRDDKVIHWVKDTYISYQASPVAVVYGGIATDTMTEQDMEEKLLASHAAYLYADEVEGDPAKLFAGMMETGTFQYGMFYEIIQNQGSIRLRALE